MLRIYVLLLNNKAYKYIVLLYVQLILEIF